MSGIGSVEFKREGGFIVTTDGEKVATPLEFEYLPLLVTAPELYRELLAARGLLQRLKYSNTPCPLPLAVERQLVRMSDVLDKANGLVPATDVAMSYPVVVSWDSETEVYMATSEHFPGIVGESPELDIAVSEVTGGVRQSVWDARDAGEPLPNPAVKGR